MIYKALEVIWIFGADGIEGTLKEVLADLKISISKGDHQRACMYFIGSYQLCGPL